MAVALTRSRLQAVGLTLPLIAFLCVTWIAPIGMVAVRSVYDPVVTDALPQTLALLEAWDGRSTPAEEVYRTAAAEFKQLRANRTIGIVAIRVNRLRSGMHNAIVRAIRQLGGKQPDSWREAMIEAHPAWREAEAWEALRQAGRAFALRHYMNALDLERNAAGAVVLAPPDERVHQKLFAQTLLTGAAVCLFCLALGYPLAFFMANSPPRWANLVLMLVFMQFWISMLVRTVAWIAMLQNQGIVNHLLVATGLVPDDGRLPLAYSLTGTIIAMTHGLLPFLVLPLYSVMRTIPPLYARAATSLGATRWQVFVHVYWPQTLPGVAAGTLLVFMLSIGQYVTPALIGGQSGLLFSNVIDYHMQKSLNWGLAGALNIVLFVCVVGVYVAYSRLVGLKRLQLS